MSFRFRAVIFFAALLWFLGIFYELLLPHFGGAAILLPFVKQTYSIVCHQQQHKLLEFGGLHTMVCARCTGIYLGFLVTSLFMLIAEVNRILKLKTAFILSIPMLLDVAFTTIGAYPYYRILSLSTGILVGCIAYLYFYAGLKKYFIEKEIEEDED